MQSEESISFMLMKIIQYTDDGQKQLQKAVDALFYWDTKFEWFSKATKNPFGCFKVLMLPLNSNKLQKWEYDFAVQKRLPFDYSRQRKLSQSGKTPQNKEFYTFEQKQIRCVCVSVEELKKEYQRRAKFLKRGDNKINVGLVWRVVTMNRKNKQSWEPDHEQNCKYDRRQIKIDISILQERQSYVPISVPKPEAQTNLPQTFNHSSTLIKSKPHFPISSPFGLPNIGNTCYMNSALQCLIHTDHLTQQIKRIIPKQQQKLLLAYSKLIQTGQKGRVDFKQMKQLKYVIEKKNSSFSGFMQNDSQMLLLTVLDTFIDELKPEPNAQYQMVEQNDELSDTERSDQFWQKEENYSKSFVSDLFRGQLRSTLKCNKCSSALRATFDPVLIVQLQVDAPVQRQIENKTNEIQMNETIQINLYYVPADWKQQVICYKVKTKEESSLGQAVNKVAQYFKLRLPPIVMIYDQEKMFQQCQDITNLMIKQVIQLHKSRVYIYQQVTSKYQDQTPTFVQYKFVGKTLSEGRYFNVIDRQIKTYPYSGVMSSYFQKVTGGYFYDYFVSYQPFDEKTGNGFRRMFVILKKDVTFNVPLRQSRTVFCTGGIDNKSINATRSYLPKNQFMAPPPCKLMDCLKQFCATTVLSPYPQDNCKNCQKKQPTDMDINLYRTGKILIFALGRFDHKTASKSRRKVDFPFQLDLTGKDSQKIHHPEQSRHAIYRLYAVINHYGSFQAGHYTAICCIKGKWYSFDDNHVSMVEEYSVVTENAYVLFYERND